MRNAILIVVAALVLVAFLVNMTTYQVDFTEKAVVTVFGKVPEERGVVSEPGLKFKWPAPISDVTTYDRRARLIEVTARQEGTADEATLVIDAFLTWSVSDPRLFFSRFNRGGGDVDNHYDAAEEVLRGRLRQAVTEVGGFTLDELFTTDGDSAIPALENAMADRVQRLVGEDAEGQAGVEIGIVGISRIVFPADVSGRVIERMRSYRESIANKTQQEGESDAARLRTEAEADSERILVFARSRAEALRAAGEREAATWFEVLNESPELSEFLAQVELLTQQGLGRTISLVLSNDMLGARFFNPEYREQLMNGGQDNDQADREGEQQRPRRSNARGGRGDE